MTDYISREAALKALHDIGGCGADKGSWADGWDKAIDEAFNIVKQFPAAEVAPVKRGRWEKVTGVYDIREEWFRCSECGCETTAMWKKNCNYCPNCGVKNGGNSDAAD